MTSAASRDLGRLAATACQPVLATAQRYRPVLIVVCLLNLSGCSGCQKTIAEKPPVVEAATTPPIDPVVETESQADSTEQPPASEPATGPAAKSTAGNRNQNSSTQASQPSSSPASPKSGGSGSGGPRVGAASPSPADSKPGASTDPAASPKTGRPPQTAAAALDVAHGLQLKSATAASREKYGQAFEISSRAWEAVHAFPEDAECQALCKQLEAEIELLADRANALVAPGAAQTKRLVEK